MSTPSEISQESLELPEYWVQVMSLGSSFLMHLTALGLLAALVLPGPRSSPSLAIHAAFPDTVLDGNGLEGFESSFDGGMDSLLVSALAADGPQMNPATDVIPERMDLAPAELMAALETSVTLPDVGDMEGTLSGAIPAAGSGQPARGGKGKANGRGRGRGTGSGVGDGNGNGMGGTGNGRGKGGFFGLTVKGKSTVFVVDASMSMRLFHPGPTQNRLNRVKLELLRTINSMTEVEKFFIIFFHEVAIPMPADRMMEAEDSVKKKYLNWMVQQDAGRNTFPEEALMMALDLKPDQIYFLTDGEFAYSVVLGVTSANVKGIPIHTIGFSDDRGANFLMQIAQRNNGTYTYIPGDETEEDLQAPGNSDTVAPPTLVTP